MLGPGRDETLFLENLQRATGPVTALNARESVGDWWFAATFRGRPVRVAISGHRGTFTSVLYAAPVPAHIRMHVEGHYAHYALAQVVRTGDAEFDRRYKVHGQPPEVVLPVLDAPMRVWFLQTYGDAPPQTHTEDGWLRIHRQVRRTRDTSTLPDSDVPSPDEIAHFLEVAVGLADRLGASYDARRAEIAHAAGPAAADAWHAAHLGTMAETARTRARIRRLVLIGVAAVFLLPLCIAAAVVVASVFGSSTVTFPR